MNKFIALMIAAFLVFSLDGFSQTKTQKTAHKNRLNAGFFIPDDTPTQHDCTTAQPNDQTPNKPIR